MWRKRTTQKSIYDEMGRIIGTEVTEEYFSEGDIDRGLDKQAEVVDVEPEVPKIQWEEGDEVIYQTPEKGENQGA